MRDDIKSCLVNLPETRVAFCHYFVRRGMPFCYALGNFNCLGKKTESGKHYKYLNFLEFMNEAGARLALKLA
ncbi:MAG: hypothetical protein A2170_15585 [Deltaproteobacteria bacterium RBG_13_53_10]|nr:MAG: hypothetical protein A2170_15585 [Deltaproteobacteria bacterium RBG_13_53_10]